MNDSTRICLRRIRKQIRGPLALFALAARVEAADPRGGFYLPLAAEPGHTLALFVMSCIDPAIGKPFEVGYNQMMLDPATGEIQGRRLGQSLAPF